jgi:hypothetical protein
MLKFFKNSLFSSKILRGLFFLNKSFQKLLRLFFGRALMVIHVKNA